MNFFLALVFCLQFQSGKMEQADEFDFDAGEHHQLDYRNKIGKSVHMKKKRNYFTAELWNVLSPHG